ncbi:hypothetical protein F5146DRAFT_1133575 [Armillaria mellea]|nr:hypothetical protein F5146DRAFT_1133575 [Armillaria mellea]
MDKNKPNVSHLKEFSCDVWILTEGQNLSKLKPKSKKFLFVGYLDGPKAIKYYNLRLRQIQVSRNFIFVKPSKAVDIKKTDNMRLEGETGSSDPQLPAGDEKSADKDKPETEKPSPTVLTVPIPSRIPQMISSSSQSYPHRSEHTIKDHNYQKMNNPDSHLPLVPRQASTSSVTIMEQSDEEDFANLAFIWSYLIGDKMPVSPNDFPQSLKEAEVSAEWLEWRHAMDEEVHTIQEMGTYTLEDLPKEREAIGSKWVFSKKIMKMEMSPVTRHDLLHKTIPEFQE